MVCSMGADWALRRAMGSGSEIKRLFLEKTPIPHIIRSDETRLIISKEDKSPFYDQIIKKIKDSLSYNRFSAFFKPYMQILTQI